MDVTSTVIASIPPALMFIAVLYYNSMRAARREGGYIEELRNLRISVEERLDKIEGNLTEHVTEGHKDVVTERDLERLMGLQQRIIDDHLKHLDVQIGDLNNTNKSLLAALLRINIALKED